MNLAYYRKSNYSVSETVDRVKEKAQQEGFDIFGEFELPKASGHIIQICNKDWLDQILKHDQNLIGVLPCSIFVTQKDKGVLAGAGNPTVMGGVTESTEVQQLSSEAEDKIRKLIDEATGSGALKPSHIKLYSTTTCPYCNMEKQWLESNKIDYELVYVDKNQEEAQKMVQKTGQMGVPVTELQYEESDPEYIVGFNKYQLGKMLGI